MKRRRVDQVDLGVAFEQRARPGARPCSGWPGELALALVWLAVFTLVVALGSATDAREHRMSAETLGR